MSLPLGFSPFDDYDSPYASTNAAIRTRQRQSQSNTPTASYSQQQSQQRRQSHSSNVQPSGSQVGVASSGERGAMLGDVPVRRPSPPPGVPAAEDFGTRRGSKQHGSATLQDSASGNIRPIARPQPMGPPLASFHQAQQQQQQQQQQAASPAVLASSDTASPPSSPNQRRPAPPPPQRAGSPSTDSAAESAPSASRLAVPAADSKPAGQRSSWSSRFFAPSRPAPKPALAQVPEPVAAPPASQVDALTPARDQAKSEPLKLTPQSSSPPPREMTAVSTAPLTVASASPTDSSSGSAGRGTDMSSTGDGYSPPSSHHSARNVGIAGAAAGAAAVGSYAAAGRRRSDEQPAHSTFDMSDDHANEDSPFTEKLQPTSAAAGSAASGSGRGPSTSAQWGLKNKGTNEGSGGRWGTNAGAGASAGLLGNRASRKSGGGKGLAASYRANKKKWWIGGAIVLLIVLIAAIVGGVVGGKSSGSGSGNGSGRSKGTGTGSSGSPSSTGPGGTGITRDPRLHNSFYGLNYEPFGTDATSGCTANITAVMEDIKLLSQLTTRIRLAGSSCNETALVLDAITRTNTDLTVWAAITLNPSTTTTGTISPAYTNQVNNITYAFNTFGTTHVGGVAIGEEFVTNDGSAATLIAYINRFKTVISQNSAWGSIQVATAEVSSAWTPALANAVDVVFANNQAWYSGIAAASAAGWAYGYLQDTVVPIARAATTSPSVVMSEFGWPTAASTTAAATVDDAVASVANLQTVLDTFVCASNANGTAYFFFEMFDFASSSRSDGVAPYWGLFDSSKQLKAITIPDCSHS